MDRDSIKALQKSLEDSQEVFNKLSGHANELREIQGMALSIRDDEFIPESLAEKLTSISEAIDALLEENI